jgi:hypothetical protein
VRACPRRMVRSSPPGPASLSGPASSPSIGLPVRVQVFARDPRQIALIAVFWTEAAPSKSHPRNCVLVGGWSRARAFTGAAPKFP